MSLFQILLCIYAVYSNLPEPQFPTDFKWSHSGRLDDYDCVLIVEPADRDRWHDNYFCWRKGKKDLGITWSYAGKIRGMRCTLVYEPSSKYKKKWRNNYLCIRESASLRFYWSKGGQIRGKTCLQWVENERGWGDNFLCANPAPNLKNPVFPVDFTWSSSGVPYGYDCVRTLEVRTPSWHDNFLCWKWQTKDPEIEWSSAGRIKGMRCTQIVEPNHDSWADNYLCVPDSSTLQFYWSHVGGEDEENCIRMHEDAVHAMHDNYLCTYEAS